MADLLAAHFSSGLVAAKLGGAERPMCGNPGTGALWRDLGFVAQRYVVKVSRPGSDHLWYFFCRREAGAQLDLVLFIIIIIIIEYFYLLLCDKLSILKCFFFYFDFFSFFSCMFFYF